MSVFTLRSNNNVQKMCNSCETTQDVTWTHLYKNKNKVYIYCVVNGLRYT